MAQPQRMTSNALLEAIAKAAGNAPQPKFGQTAAVLLNLMNGTPQTGPFKDIIDAAGAAGEVSNISVQNQRGLVVSKDDLKNILKYVNLAKSLPLTEADAEIYLGYKSDDPFFDEEKHKFLLPKRQVEFDLPIYNHAVQWDGLAVDIQNIGNALVSYSMSFKNKADSTIKVLEDLNQYLKVHGFIADDTGKDIVEAGTETLNLWKKDTLRHQQTVKNTYDKLGTFRSALTGTIDKSIRDRGTAIRALDLGSEIEKLQQQVQDLKDDIELLQKEYNEEVGLAFTGAGGLIFGLVGILSWAITGGIFGDKAEKTRKEKNAKENELAPLEKKLKSLDQINGNISELETSTTDLSLSLASADTGMQHLIVAWDGILKDIDSAVEHLNNMDDPEYVKRVAGLTSELKDARDSWDGCYKIAEELVKCFTDAYQEAQRNK
ncbi:MAG: alpha-xenorhabdolysin family binary toxin subunit A [Eubacterium sp.]|nr:alpha-xenorhabdolysin family binary toxin subunit A [Eubacterium sp.]